MVGRSAEAEPGAWTVAALGSRGRIVIIGCREKKELKSQPGSGNGEGRKSLGDQDNRVGWEWLE